jgi:GDPmannose 4,6-dehydratase
VRKVAFITGIGGQDGNYLARELLLNGYEVHGIVRRNSIPEHQESRISDLIDKVSTYYGDLTDISSIQKLIEKIEPTHIFNLAAQSHVRISFDIPYFTSNVNGLGALNMIEIAHQVVPQVRFYQASSSEMFGTSVDIDGFQRETTKMLPASPYGAAKLFAYHIARTYRDSYNMFISNGILFNHESPNRGTNFVTSKVIKEAVKISRGQSKTILMGNLESSRDWGHSKDYVRAMRLILEHKNPDDFVVATGISHSVRELCEYVFAKFDLNFEDYVVLDEKYLRPKEVPHLKGDATKIRDGLGWIPEYTFETLLDEMIEFELKKNYESL